MQAKLNVMLTHTDASYKYSNIYNDLPCIADYTNPLVLISGSGATSSIWQGNFLKELAQGREVVTFDPRGIGSADNVPLDTLTIDDIATSLSRLLRRSRIWCTRHPWMVLGCEYPSLVLSAHPNIKSQAHASWQGLLHSYTFLSSKSNQIGCDSVALWNLQTFKKTKLYTASEASQSRSAQICPYQRRTKQNLPSLPSSSLWCCNTYDLNY